MNMKIYNVTGEQANALEPLVMPDVWALEEREEFWYFVAIEEGKQILGVAVVDPINPVAELLSIAVVPTMERQGIATALLLHGKEVLEAEAFEGLAMTMGLEQKDWEIMDGLMKKSGFELDSEEKLEAEEGKEQQEELLLRSYVLKIKEK